MLDRSFIRQSAAAAGFDLCGVAPCRHLVRNEQFFRRWLGDGRHASLGYLERNLDKRFDVRRLVEGAQTAVEAGLGWIGRQSLLVTPRFGSFVLLGELVLDAACDRYDEPLAGAGCGSCRRCVEACPTGAVCNDRAIDARRCISCHTIERTPAAEIALDGWIFGCDACQSRCPYNLRAPLHLHPAFDPLSFPPERWLAMEEAEFRTSFGRTPLMRSGLRRLQANAAQNLRRKG